MSSESIDPLRIANEYDLSILKKMAQNQPIVSIAFEFFPYQGSVPETAVDLSEVIAFGRKSMSPCCCFCMANFDTRDWTNDERLELISPVHGVDEAEQSEDEFMITIVEVRDFRTLDFCASRGKSPLRVVVILFEGTPLTKGGELAIMDRVLDGIPRWMGTAKTQLTANFK